MPINAHPDYLNAEQEYFEAETDEEKLLALEKMIRFAPSHKGGENLRKNLKTRYKKLKQELRIKKKKITSKKGIKKQDMQAVLIGLTNSGKSSILKSLTNANPRIASYGFTTSEPEIGTLNYQNCSIQLIENPPIGADNFDKGLVNNTDILLIVIEKTHELESVLSVVKKQNAKKIIVFNKIDQYDEVIKRKIYENLKSKKYNFVLVSALTGEGLDELKERIFKSFDIARIYTRQPGKKEDNVPVIMKPHSTLENVAEKILHGYSKKVKFAKIFGPSAKFLGQKVGLKHIIKDNDIIEFYTE